MINTRRANRSVDRFKARAVFAAAATIGCAALQLPAARGVVLYTDPTNPALPSRNTAAPVGTLSNSGWQYEGQFNGVLVTPIAPQYFISAEHTGGTIGQTMTLGGKTYTTTNAWDDPNTDLRIWKTAEAMPTYAPLWSSANGNEANKTLTDFGIGNARSSLVTTTHDNGWVIVTGDGAQTWGQNVVSGTLNGGAGVGTVLKFTFDSPTTGGIDNEGMLTFGDSSGGLFIQDAGGTWRLAGVNFSAELGDYSTSNTGANPFKGVIFDKRGLFVQNSSGTWVSAGSGAAPVPAAAFASSIAANSAFINSVINVPTWSLNGSGTWSNAGNWTDGVPGGSGQTANFAGAITAAATVTLDSPRTVGLINFDNANRYTIAGSSTLTISDAPLGNINVVNGSHTIATPVNFAVDTRVQVAPATATLTLSGDMSASSGVTLTKVGAGTLDAKNVRVDNFDVQAGSVRVMNNGTSSGTSRAKTLSLAGGTNAWTSRLNVNNNALVVDYSGASPRATIENQIKSGFAGGSWTGNGISSGAAAGQAGSAHRTALGIVEASDVFSVFPASFKGQSVDNTSVLVRYTYAGDANIDGTVDLTDFTFLATSFNATGKRWVNGDFNYDGTVDLTDFTLLAANFNQTAPADGDANAFAAAGATTSLGTTVPEPAAVGISLVGAGLLLRRRHRPVR